MSVDALIEDAGTKYFGKGIRMAAKEICEGLTDEFVPDRFFVFLPGGDVENGGRSDRLEVAETGDVIPKARFQTVAVSALQNTSGG
jgi:hypothetical protein